MSLLSLHRVGGASSSYRNPCRILVRKQRHPPRQTGTTPVVVLPQSQRLCFFFSTNFTPHPHHRYPTKNSRLLVSGRPPKQYHQQPPQQLAPNRLSFLARNTAPAIASTQCDHAIVNYPSPPPRLPNLSSSSSSSSAFTSTATTDGPQPQSSSSSLSFWTTRSSSVRQKIRRALRMILRLLKLSVVLTPVALCYPILLLANPNHHHNNNNSNNNNEKRDAHDVLLEQHQQQYDNNNGNISSSRNNFSFIHWYFRLCLHCVEYSGAAAVKLMQWAGSRPDLFGHAFCSVFSQLQDRARPHSWRHTVRVMQQEFGPDWDQRIFLRQEQPGDILGSGCIGQVYRGQVVLEDGCSRRDVAIKVLHPNVEEDIDADLDLMRLTVKVVERLPFDLFSGLKWLNLAGIVEEFASLLKHQLDLRHEARNLERFNANFKDDESVIFPKVIPGYEPKKNVLIETYCDGIPVLQFARENANDRELLHNMCLTAINIVCKMIFRDNLIHGDLHPGNVYVSRDGNKFILFDVGMVAEYTDKDHQNLVSLLAAFVRKQGRKAGRLMIDESNNRLRASNSGDCALDEELYLDKIEQLTIRASSKDYLMEHLGTYISYICNAAAQHHIMMNPCFISAALAVKVQEGIALALDPSVKISKVASPIVIESELRLLTAEAGRKLGLRQLFETFFGKKESRKIGSLSSQ